MPTEEATMAEAITRREALTTAAATAAVVTAAAAAAAVATPSATGGASPAAGASGATAAAKATGAKAKTGATGRMPTLYLPHGGGPCFFMEWTMGPRDTWDKTADWLRGIPASLPERPRALLVISAHWEQPEPTLMTSPKPPMLFDYYGFPEHTYQLDWPAAGAPELADEIAGLLGKAGIATRKDASRGFDHGVFVPLLLAFPKADIPTLQLSLRRGLDPKEHLAVGRALAPLRDKGVLIVGSGMSYHNMRGFMRPQSLAESRNFDAWLDAAARAPRAERERQLADWAGAPAARACHPREEHLLPLMVCAGAGGDDAGRVDFRDVAMGVQLSAIRFG